MTDQINLNNFLIQQTMFDQKAGDKWLQAADQVTWGHRFRVGVVLTAGIALAPVTSGLSLVPAGAYAAWAGASSKFTDRKTGLNKETLKQYRAIQKKPTKLEI